MRRKLFMFLAMALVLLLIAACGREPELTPTLVEDPPVSSGEAAASEDPIPGPATQEYEFARVTWFFNQGGIQIPQDNSFTQAALEAINVEFVPINPETPDFQGHLFAFLAAGEQIDVIHTWRGLEQQLVMDGVIQPVGHWLNENYLPNVIRIAYRWDDVLMDSLRHPDGLIYGIPNVSNHFVPDQADWIRADWLEHVGMDVPTTYEELEEVLRAFANSDPNGDGINFFPYMVNEMYGLQHIFRAHAAGPDWHWAEDGYLELGILSPRVVPVLEMLNRWFEEGLINQDFMTTAHTEIVERVRSGLVGYDRGWGNLGDALVIQEIYPDAQWIPILPLRSQYFDQGYFSYYRRTSFAGQHYSIHVNARDIDAIFRLMNFMADDTATSTEPGNMTFEGGYWKQFGVRGENWDVINGFFVGPAGPGTWEDPIMQAAADRFETAFQAERWTGWAVRRFFNIYDTRWRGVDPRGQEWVQWRENNLGPLIGCNIPATNRYRAEVTPMPVECDDFTLFSNTFAAFRADGAFSERLGFPAIMGVNDIQTLFDNFLEFANSQGYQEARRTITQHILDNPF